MSYFHPALTIPFAAALALLSGCSEQQPISPVEREVQPDPTPDASPTLSPESLEMAQTAWLSISEDGEVFTTFLDADGRYRDESGGELVYSGTWEQNPDLELCFTPAEGKRDCWSHGAPGRDGVMRATNRSGLTVEVRKVAYKAPPSQADASAQGEGEVEGEGEEEGENSSESDPANTAKRSGN